MLIKGQLNTLIGRKLIKKPIQQTNSDYNNDLDEIVVEIMRDEISDHESNNNLPHNKDSEVTDYEEID